jgi:hypothetical protein
MLIDISLGNSPLEGWLGFVSVARPSAMRLPAGRYTDFGVNVWPEWGIRLRYFMPILREWTEVGEVPQEAGGLGWNVSQPGPYNRMRIVCRYCRLLASMKPEVVSTPELGLNVSVPPRLRTDCETGDDHLHTTSWLHDASHVGPFRKDQKDVSVCQRVWQRVSLWQMHKAPHINLVYNSSWTLESGAGVPREHSVSIRRKTLGE